MAPDDPLETPTTVEDTADLASGSPEPRAPTSPTVFAGLPGHAPVGSRELPWDISGHVPGDIPAVPWEPLILAPGTTAGGYRIESLIARGGFGAVYQATAPDGTTVALKLLHRELALAKDVLARFEREISVIALLAHANTPRILEIGKLADGQPFYTMELLRGPTLATRVRAEGPLGVAELLAVVEPLCLALSAAHARGVVHRDIKPSNVMLADRVVLLDFGIAKLLDDSEPALTRSRHVVGSPVAMSPEQIRGGPIDARTDVYGLGVLAYFALSGHYPFAHLNVAVLEQLHLERDPPPLTDRAPVPAAVAAVIHRALAKVPDRRPADAATFCAELRAAAGGGTVVVGVRVEVISRRPPHELSDDELDRLEAVLPIVIAQLGAAGLSLTSRGQDDALMLGATPDRRDHLLAVARRLLEVGEPLADLSFTFRVGKTEDLQDSSGWPAAAAREVAFLD